MSIRHFLTKTASTVNFIAEDHKTVGGRLIQKDSKQCDLQSYMI